MSSHRIRRLGDAIRASLSDLLLTETRDPRLRLATITSVEVSRDLQVADVAVSITDPEEDREEFLRVLRGAAGFLRSQLAKRLDLRHTPELRFRIDRGAEHSERIEALLDELDVRSEDEGGEGGGIDTGTDEGDPDR